MTITAIVLAGGRGSRMGYRDKAWVNYNGQPLLMYVINAISESVDDIIISSSRDNPEYASLNLKRVPDQTNEFLGPLSGIISSLPYVESDLTLVVPCDVPNLPDNITSILCEKLETHDVCVAHDGEQLQSLTFVARTEILGSIANYLDEGKRSVFGWLQSVDYTVAALPDNLEKFRNINTLPQA